MEVLLEVVAEREVEERPAVRGQLHRRRQAALDDREVARREVAVELVDVRADLEPVVRRQRLAGSMRGPATTIIRSAGHALLRLRERRRSRAAAGAPPTPEPPTVTMQTCSSVAVAELGPQRLAVGERRGSKPVT